MRHVAVIGGGITGLAAAWTLAGGRRASGAASDPRVTLVEAAPRLGGKIATERADGFLVEAAADSFSAARPQGLELVRALGLGDRLLASGAEGGAGDEPTPPVGERVYLLSGGRLQAMPRGLALVVPTRAGPVLSSPLLSARGKARLALELVLPRRRAGRRRGECFTDESVASFVSRRMGREYLDRVAGPLLAGIHSTPAEELSVEAAFPRLAALERSHRSLILGMRRAHRGPAASGAGGAPARNGAGPRTGSARVSLAGGMGELVAALVERLEAGGAELLTGRPVVELAPADPADPAVGGARWRLRLAGGEPLGADAVVLTVPPAAAAGLVEDAAPALAEGLRSIPSASTATVSLGFPRGALGRDLDAAGFLVPPQEGSAVGACTFSSAKLPGRAPAGHHLVRAFVRGSGSHRGARDDAGGGGVDLAAASDDELVELVLRQLAPVLGVSAPPVLTRVHRFADPTAGANPQYLLGHCERVRGIEAAAPPGLLLAGCAYHGLGIPDCIASGARAAAAALAACR